MKVRSPSGKGLLFVLCVVVASVLAYAVYLVAQKHLWAQTLLSEISPRHARLSGLQAAKPDLEAAIARAQHLHSQLVYPSTQDTNQTGNAAQQRIRDILSASGLQVLSSQVLPPSSAGGAKDPAWDRIALNVRTEGDALGLYAALSALSMQLPVILVKEMDVQFQSQPTYAPARLSMQFSLVVLRDPS
ncbi:MAG: general secretion pathway protein GspM [Rhizobacter sp.]